MGPNRNFDIVAIGSLFLSALALLGGFARIVWIRDHNEALSSTTLEYFAAAAAFLLLQKVKTLSFGETKIDFRQVEEKVDQALEVAKTAMDAASADPVKEQIENRAEIDPIPVSRNTLKSVGRLIQEGKYVDDPWKGQFGGKSESNGRRLSAQVRAIVDSEDYFLVRLTVESVDLETPLTGLVQFFLHDSFTRNKPVVKVVDGRAEFRCRAYGAFTVGALADDGNTRLELDLATDRSFPAKFRSR